MGKRDRNIRSKMARPRAADISLRSIEIFLRVVESGGMTSAARLLGLSQSAVSQSILSLEKELNVLLLDRSERPVVPTLSGSLLIEEGKELLRAHRGVTFAPQIRYEACRFDHAVGPHLAMRPSMHRHASHRHAAATSEQT